MRNVVLLGPPGVGKGTQGKMVSEKFNIPIISTGDMLREAVKKGTQMGLEAKSYMDSGGLVPDEVVIGIVVDRLKERDTEKGFILDGFPRNLSQAETLQCVLDDNQKSLNHVVGFDADQEEIVKRLSGRRVCKQCGEGYHVIFSPPLNQGLCDKCNGELYQRSDDEEDTIRERLRVYEEQTRPLVAFYKKKGILKAINGLGSIEDIFDRTVRALEE